MWTWLAFLTLFICIIIILIEFIWLYILSARSESKTIANKKAEQEIKSRIQTIVHSPTSMSQESEIQDLKKYVKNDRLKMDILSTNLLELIKDDPKETDVTKKEIREKAFYATYTAINPAEFYSVLLRTGNAYDKAYACRKLSDYYASEEIENIRKLAFSKNKDLAYNAAITLSVLGDEQGLMKVILEYENNYEMSHRIIIEILEKYSGDFDALARKLLEKADEYIRAAVVKALAKSRSREFESTYFTYLKEGSINLKIAALRAIGSIARPEHEHELIVASHHKNWAVRSAAIKAMIDIPSDNIFQAISQATKDPEWWVRYNAAKTLVAMDHDFFYIEKILQGYDKFASDAIKHALYQVYFMKMEEKAS